MKPCLSILEVAQQVTSEIFTLISQIGSKSNFSLVVISSIQFHDQLFHIIRCLNMSHFEFSPIVIENYSIVILKSLYMFNLNSLYYLKKRTVVIWSKLMNVFMIVIEC